MGQNRITNLKEAKKIFIECDCSTFHMGREYTNRYIEYRDLNISKSDEEKWRKEALKDKYKELINETDDRKIINLIFRIITILGSFNDIENIKLLINAVNIIMSHTDSFSKMLIAESFSRIDEKIDIKEQSVNIEIHNIAVDFATEVVNSPFFISNSTYSESYLSYGDTLSKEKIYERAKKIIR